MGASRPGMPLRGCARRTGLEVRNHTRREKQKGPLWPFLLFWRWGESSAEDALWRPALYMRNFPYSQILWFRCTLELL